MRFSLKYLCFTDTLEGFDKEKLYTQLFQPFKNIKVEMRCGYSTKL